MHLSRCRIRAGGASLRQGRACDVFFAVCRVVRGGGVFGARVCPDERGAYAGLLAIHGRSEGYGQSGGRSGTSLGIPLDSIKTFLENAKYIPSGKNYELLVKNYAARIVFIEQFYGYQKLAFAAQNQMQSNAYTRKPQSIYTVERVIKYTRWQSPPKCRKN